MISGVRFMASSGHQGNTIASLYAAGKSEPGTEIFQLIAGDTTSPTRVGFFGAQGAPSSPIVVGQYQQRTHRTDHDGSNLGTLVNVRFTGASTADVSGVPITGGLSTIAAESGTLLLRFREPNDTLVVTQNTTFRAVATNANSGVPSLTTGPSNLTVKAFQHQDTFGNASNASWTDISDPNSTVLTLNSQAVSTTIHDWHVSVSVSPTAAGVNRLWGFYVSSDYL